jgi:hypothetical protein
MYLPTVTNVPALLALRATSRASTSRVGASGGGAATGSNGGGAKIGSGATLSAPVGTAARRYPGAQVRNPNRTPALLATPPFSGWLEATLRFLARSQTVL